jgi:hypothetical protein
MKKLIEASFWRAFGCFLPPDLLVTRGELLSMANLALSTNEVRDGALPTTRNAKSA